MRTLAKQRAVFDLAAYQADCEQCFYLLRKLVIDWRVGAVRTLELPEIVNEPLQLHVTECQAHTRYLDIHCPSGLQKWVRPFEVKVCLYFDVKMAEIIYWNGQRLFWPRVQYPHPEMWSEDEKHQRLQVLIEWMKTALRAGADSEYSFTPG